MPRNGSGIYGPPAGTAAVPNTPIESAKYNAFVDDAAEALTNSVNVNGTAAFQANQAMGGFKHTNLGTGSAAGDSVNLGQAQSGIVAHATAVGGTPDAITASFSPPFTAYAARMRFRFTANAANTLVNPTVNVDGLGARTIKKLNGAALAVGDIAGTGHVCDCLYDGSDVILLNPALASGGGQNVFTARQTFNGPLVKGTTVLVDAATIAWDLATGADFKVTITSNRTLGAFSNGTPGQEGLLTVVQDGTGGWSLNLGNPVYDFWGPSIENIARGPNEETVYEYKVISPASLFLRRRGATSIGGPGRDLLAAIDANNSANINFVLTKWLPLYDRFEIEYEDVLAQIDNAEFWMRVSSNGGSTFDSGGADYKYVYQLFVHTGFGAAANIGDSKIVIGVNGGNVGLSNVAGETAAGTVVIHKPGAAQRLKVTWKHTLIPADINFHVVMVDGVGVRDTVQDADAIRLLPSSGNIASGQFRLYGIRK